MQSHTGLDFHLLRFPETMEFAAQYGDFLAARDAVRMLRLIGTLAPSRGDPRAWRQELLGGLSELLGAAASASFVLKNINGDAAEPAVVSFFDAGFRHESHLQAFAREFNDAPFRDPLARACLERFTSQRLTNLTCLRAEVIDDQLWIADPHVQAYRRPTGTGDCMLSLQRGIERGIVHALLCFKTAAAEAAEGSAPAGPRPNQRFTPRDRLVLDTLHRGLEGFYRGEEAAQKLNRAAGLTPRLRQTLEFLLSGDTERQVAIKLSLSVHTVHDYVKALYAHFGVSSRTELLAKWMQTGGQFPRRPEK